MPDSLENVMTKWYPEASHFCPDASIFLVACKVDLRNDQHVNYRLSKSGHHPISTFEGQQMASMIGATEYVECSAMINYNVGRVFELATRAALKIKTRRDRKRDKCKVL
jgi:GTPase SAR1 family protein